jgi:hypothetical protein
MEDFERASKLTQSPNVENRQEAERYLKAMRNAAQLELLKQVLGNPP